MFYCYGYFQSMLRQVSPGDSECEKSVNGNDDDDMSAPFEFVFEFR